MKKTYLGLLVGLVLVILSVLLYVFKPLGKNFIVIGDLLPVLFSLLAFVFGLYAYKLHGFKSLQGKAMLFLSLGIFLWFLGEAIWSFYEIVIGIMEPSSYLADLAWLVGYLLFTVGLYYEWKITRIKITKDKKFLIALLIVLILFSVSWYGIVPALKNHEIGALEKSVAIGYVIGDLILIVGCCVVVISFLGGKFTKPWIIITSAIILGAVADIVYSYLSNSYETGNWIDLLWDLNYILVAFGFFYYRQLMQGQLANQKGGE